MPPTPSPRTSLRITTTTTCASILRSPFPRRTSSTPRSTTSFFGDPLDVTGAEGQWTIPTDQGGIVGQPAARAILGQPFYADGMFFGCEFPAADTQIVNGQGKKIGRPRYYTGKTMKHLANDGQAVRAEDGTIRYSTWQTVAGAAAAKDYRVVQANSSITSTIFPRLPSSAFSTTLGTTTRRTSPKATSPRRFPRSTRSSPTGPASTRMPLTMAGPTTVHQRGSGRSTTSSPMSSTRSRSLCRTSAPTSVFGLARAADTARTEPSPTPCSSRAWA